MRFRSGGGVGAGCELGLVGEAGEGFFSRGL